jgi:hypothetical protein
LEPFILIVSLRRAYMDFSRSRLALLRDTINGQIAKRRALCWRSRRQSLLVGSRAKPLALRRFK